ncbi:MAG: hypothetical protein UX89_C0026G0010 [Parcubacteria group bacterium GW2011_GWA2_47_16]|nr:MAG: hypothetical protein UX89_C0026G0010 [Parcubacteria group bacterium GW2011_GWA2_47_16]
MKKLYIKLKPHASSLAFVAGFIWDSMMLERIDHTLAKVMLTVYLCLAAVSIIVLNMHEVRRARGKAAYRYSYFLPLILQFCFGSLFSAYIIFYTASASLADNWPFLIFLVFLVFSNEIFRARYLSPIFQLCTLFVVLFSYSIFSLPIILGRMGGDVFVLSGLWSLGAIICIGLLLRLVAREVFARSLLPLVAGISVIYALFNIAYFTNIIPPVPLSLKEIGVYHHVVREFDGTYKLTFERGSWYPLFKGTSDVYHREDNESVYVWSSIFAPTKLVVPIFHVWSYFDEIDKVWVTTDRLEFSVVGGREEGYRGYTFKQSVFPARWRVDVETARKERVGLVEFKIIGASKPEVNLTTENR